MFTRIAYCIAPTLLAGVCAAGPVVFPISAGGTGNTYEVIADANASYHDAQSLAAAAGGHLATITSAAEQSFIENLLISSSAPTGAYWIGLERTSGDSFAWTTGEPFVYQNFAEGEPNNFLGFEDRGQVYWSRDTADDFFAGRRGGWNDAPAVGWTITNVQNLDRAGFIVEASAATGGTPPPVPIPLPPALLAAPLAGVVAAFVMRRKRVV